MQHNEKLTRNVLPLEPKTSSTFALFVRDGLTTVFTRES